MIWYLLMCTGDLSNVCAAPQPMPSQSGCLFVRRQYVSMAQKSAEFRCVGVRRPAGE